MLTKFLSIGHPTHTLRAPLGGRPGTLPDLSDTSATVRRPDVPDLVITSSNGAKSARPDGSSEPPDSTGSTRLFVWCPSPARVASRVGPPDQLEDKRGPRASRRRPDVCHPAE